MNEETLNKMKQMKFFGMAGAFQASLESDKLDQMTTDEMITFLIDSEYDDRNDRRVKRNIKNAKFRYDTSVESVKYDSDRNLDKNQMMRYADCSFINKHENILITGLTGIGKSYIASALGQHACRLGYKVLYANTAKLFSKLKMSKADGSYIREIDRIEKKDLLILDDFGLQPFDQQTRMLLMEIIEDRHDKRSMIITSQIPVSKWYDVIGDKTIGDAILDRIVHNAHRIDLKGESLRKRKAKNTDLEMMN